MAKQEIQAAGAGQRLAPADLVSAVDRVPSALRGAMPDGLAA